MAETITLNPTSNSSPDPGQGGNPVTGNTNTGHSNTTVSVGGGSSSFDSCIWTGFSNSVAGIVLGVTLKVDWSESGSLTGGGFRTNLFSAEYSINGGSSWNSLFNHVDVTSANSGTASVSLSLSQNITQVQVRDTLVATANVGNSAQITGAISNIRLEVALELNPVVCANQ